MKEEIIKEINKVFEVNLTIEDIDKNIEDVIEWSSYEALLFMNYLQEKYQKKVLLKELVKLHKIGDMIDVIKSRKFGD